MTRVKERDIELADGRTLHVYEAGRRRSSRLPIMWHHGTPNVGSPPEPLMRAAKDAGLRWVSFDRPGYGGSTRHEGRTVASVARDALAAADALGLDRFAVMGHSGGGSPALAMAALAPDRVVAVTTSGSLAPLARTPGDPGLDIDAWFDGMGPISATSLRAALDGPNAKRAYEASAGDGIDFTSRDFAALAGEWGWLGTVAAAGVASGPDALIDDDLAYVAPWGVDLARITAPTLLVHGAEDRVVPAAHSRWLAGAVPGATHWQLEGEGHISTLADDERGAAAAVRWVGEHLAGS
ncbi:pimeloyl-ACP methyl ester carboxylesterase [Microcella putealis]|uniref:Pimeloyl-ACP methyl ester carboxylesterase n=1 Tax=Microcella putealis TaxID=337005 RepID=A0A4Q7LNP4_9MICO|nr:alpha/beta hydrolase [Microcella putealis]RZS56335.1 pimeloyl-ACP methyl ester carboxylesterase [Microcella putealis]TQM27179.1 pimeloyl-ACP methyl ester carboxylesterase [Microcella putealis]